MDYFIEIRNKSTNEVQIIRLRLQNVADAKYEARMIAKEQYSWKYQDIIIRPLLRSSDWFGLRVNEKFLDMYADFERSYTNKKD